jgi:type IV pilus assembly protein PilE
MRRVKGFTLIELMVTVAIVAILSSIALPSYTAYVQRSRITEAVSGLAGMGVNMERFFQDNRTYEGACTNGTVAQLPKNTANFSFTAVPCSLSATAFTVTAEGTGSMAGFTYTLNEANVRATTSVPSGWTKSATCWALKPDGSC